MPMLSFFISIPPVRVADRNHHAEYVLLRLGIEHHRVGKHAAVPADVLHGAGGLPVVVAQPGTGVAHDVELAAGIVWRTVPSCLIVSAGAFHGAIVLGDVESDR